MKLNVYFRAVAVLVGAVTVGGCGGGSDDESGALTEFTTVPTSTAQTAPAGTAEGVCVASTSSVEVFVFGGTAPYEIKNSYPRHLEAVSNTGTNMVSKGGSVIVTYLGGCLSPGVITLEDRQGRIREVEVSNEPAAAAG